MAGKLTIQSIRTDGFVPRWECGAWTPLHGWTHIISDIAIGLAYAAIPTALSFFVTKRKDVPFPPIFWLFGLNGSPHFIPMPPPSGVAGQFLRSHSRFSDRSS